MRLAAIRVIKPRRVRDVWRFLTIALALAALGAGEPVGSASTAINEAARIPPGSGEIQEFLSCELSDGVRYLAVPIPADMPWRVAIGMPRTSPKYASRKQGRAAAIEAMQEWERAIQTRLRWFELEFVEKDRDAPVQIRWKRRTVGNAQGRAGPTCKMEAGRIKAGGKMEVSVRSCPTCSTLTAEEIGLLIAHEFGHVLGLGHCLDCDSAMNYSWQTEERISVTAVDVDGVVRRFAAAGMRPSGGTGTLNPAHLVALAAETDPVPIPSATAHFR